MENIVKEFDIEEVEALEAPVSGDTVAGFVAGGATICIIAGAAYLAC
ncbi:MAG: hypothetical protein IKK91_03475 [Ruminococcus sp.]|nr:hypothetical protein [Ruminococcus sp.]